MIQIKRVYEPASSRDGIRVLIDRLWPRGISRADAHLDEWIKDIAPSDRLRRWFGHDPARFAEFRRRYELELDLIPEIVSTLKKMARKKTLTLLYAAKDEAHNQAVVLRDYLLRRKPRIRRHPGSSVSQRK